MAISSFYKRVRLPSFSPERSILLLRTERTIPRRQYLIVIISGLFLFDQLLIYLVKGCKPGADGEMLLPGAFIIQRDFRDDILRVWTSLNALIGLSEALACGSTN